MSVPALTKPKRTQAEATAEVETFGKFIVGYAVLWFALTAMSESPKTAPLASAFALAIAGVATVYYLPEAVKNLGLASK